eukprot:gene8830-71_t
MDFRTEFRNAKKLADIVREDNIARVHVPHMYQELSTPRIIIMEWIEGTKITDVAELHRLSINPGSVGLTLIRLFAELIFIKGFVHGDPHPGNIMVRAKGRRSFLNWLLRGSYQPFELVLIDHGMYLEISPEIRETFCQLWCSFVSRNKAVQRDVCLRLGGERAAMALPVLLTHQAKTQAEEQAVRKQAGLTKFTDMTAMMAAVNKELVELLRINSIIRSVSSKLGLTVLDRMRMYAWYVRRGIPPQGLQANYIDPYFDSALNRFALDLTVLDRRRMYAWYARRGMPPRGLQADHINPYFDSALNRFALVTSTALTPPSTTLHLRGMPPRGLQADHINPYFNSALNRFSIVASLSLWTVHLWTKSAAQRAWSCIAGIVGEAIFD